MELQFLYFCCDNGCPDGSNVEVGLTDQIVYHRHVGEFLMFPMCGVWFNLYDKKGHKICWKEAKVIYVEFFNVLS
jgi:hypothetical protein